MATTTPNEPPLLVVERKDVAMVKPSQPTPSHLLSLSTIDNDPNLQLLCQTILVYTNNSDPTNQSDPLQVIRNGLSKALTHYYPFAGKLRRHEEDGRLRADCTGEGVPLCSATANCTLSSLNYLNGISVDTAKHLVFDVETPREAGFHPVVFQVTRFACGGFTVGMGMSHSMADGIGAAQFFEALGELARVPTCEPSTKPVWERELLVASPPASQELVSSCMQLDPTDHHMPGCFATSPHLPSSDLVHGSLDVAAGSIRRLKAEWGEEGESVTTLEALGACIWRSKFRALDMNIDGKTTFSLTIGIRSVMDPPLPEGYYGNAFVGSPVVLEGRELCEWPLSRVAMVIKESKQRAAKAEHVKAFLCMVEKNNRENRRIEAATGSATIVTDWRHMGLTEVDFGWKKAVNVVPVPWNMFGYVDLCILLPPFGMDPGMKGGVRVLVCLPRPAMERFEEEMAALICEEDIS